MKSPLRYPGGKSRLLKEILKYVPSETQDYREPFLGGGSVLFHLMEAHPTWNFHAGDNFSLLFKFYWQLQNNPEQLYRAIKNLKATWTGKELFERSRELLVAGNDAHRAAAFYILNRITFSGLTLSGGYSQAAYEGRFKDAHIEKLRALGTKMENLNLYQDSYEKLMFMPGQDVWLFLDPPYDIKSSNLYGISGNQHKGFDHSAFAEDCKRCRHKFLLTYNSNEHIKNLFKWANIQEVEVIYNMNSSGKKKTELFITNY